jgi:diguanylate cyclase (GGDEF)-like protein
MVFFQKSKGDFTLMKNEIVKHIINVATATKFKPSDIVGGEELRKAQLYSFTVMILSMGIICTLVFGTIAFFSEIKSIYAIVFEYSLAFIFIVALINVWQRRNFFINGIVIPLVIYAVLFSSLWFQGSSDNLKGIWVLVLPIINIRLGGHRFGFVLTIIQYLFTALVALIPDFGYNYEFNAFLKFSGVYWCIAVLVLVFEIIRSKAEENIDYLNRVISDKKEMEEKEEYKENWLGIYNQSGFLALSDVIWKQAIRDRLPVSILMIDIDDFTELNKKYGYWTCEDILKQITEIIRSNVRRPLDIIGRYRNNVYAVQLYSTNSEAALCIAERIHKRVYESEFEHKGFIVKMPVSVSIGVATQEIPNLDTSIEVLLSTAQSNLEGAKSKGGNNIYSDCSNHSDESENGSDL